MTIEECETVDGVKYRYLTGWGNELSSETIPGALPNARNNPKHVPFGLYTEQLSGTAFTTPRAHNKRTWLYRIQPSVANYQRHQKSEPQQFLGACAPDVCTDIIDPMRWNPPTPNNDTSDFIEALRLVSTTAGGGAKHSLSIYQYSGKLQAGPRHLLNTDGDFLWLPSQGTLHVETELGRLTISPKELGVIPRNIVFSVTCEDDGASGYVLELDSTTGFLLPELGPLGANGLANPRDFLHPAAWCTSRPSDYNKSCILVTKRDAALYSRAMDHSPYNVVAWHGNYLPYKYNLRRFCAVNSVSYDHLDPSIYTVLTCPSGTPGTALVDVVVFPPRVMATDSNTFRPPWFHRNCMSEFMGLVYGSYDAKEGSGFLPGGMSLHNIGTPHGPDCAAYEKAIADECATPVLLDKGMAFMFETYLPLKVNPEFLQEAQEDYEECWEGLEDNFTGWEQLANHLG